MAEWAQILVTFFINVLSGRTGISQLLKRCRRDHQGISLGSRDRYFDRHADCRVQSVPEKVSRGFIGGIYTDVIRGTPSVTQLMIIYFVIFASVQLDKWIIAAIAFGINSGAYVSEIIRAGILSIDKGQTEAGRSLGLSAFQTMSRIVIPQAVKNIFPALCNEFIVLIKETAIVGYVGLMDIQKAGDFIKSATFIAFMPLIGTAVIYYVLIKILTLSLGRIEARLRKADAR